MNIYVYIYNIYIYICSYNIYIYVHIEYHALGYAVHSRDDGEGGCM